MLILVKLLFFCPFNDVDSGVPSSLKRSTRTVSGPLELLVINTSSVLLPPYAAYCGNNTPLAPPMVAVPVPVVVVIDGSAAAVRSVAGSVLNCFPLNLRPITENADSEVMSKVPVTSRGIDFPLENNCVTNSDIWCKAGTVSVVVASCVPSAFLNVKVTFAFELFGFTIATPRFLERRPSLSTHRSAWVFRLGGNAPACAAPAVEFRSPNVSNTTNPVVKLLVVVVTGVTIA